MLQSMPKKAGIEDMFISSLIVAIRLKLTGDALCMIKYCQCKFIQVVLTLPEIECLLQQRNYKVIRELVKQTGAVSMLQVNYKWLMR